MSALERLDGSLARFGSSDSELPTGLVLLSGAIAAAVLSPIAWLLFRVVNAETDVSLVTQPTTLLTSIGLVAVVTGASVLLGVPLAFLTVRTDLPFRRFWTIAVALPLAPLGLFLVNTVRPLSVWSAALVFLGGWLAPAAYLARARVPAEAFARSCYLIGLGTALVPAGLRFGGNGLAATDASVSFGTVAAVALLVAALALLLGRFMHRQASRRVSGDLRAFEDARLDADEPGEN